MDRSPLFANTIAIFLALGLVGCGGGPEKSDSGLLGVGWPDSPMPMVNAGSPQIEPAPSESATEFIEWQQTARKSLLKLIPLNDRSSGEIRYRVLNTTTVGPSGLIRSIIVFRSFDDAEIPAVLQYLDHERLRPGVLVIPGHVTDRESGLNESGLNETVFAHLSYQKAAATELAMAGFVTLSFELRGFGLLGSDLDTNHLHVAYNAIAQGSSYKALVLRDAQFAFELLRTLPQTDPFRLATAGASYGGEIAVALAALDPRVAAVAFSSYGGRIGPFRSAFGRQTKQRHYCHVIPGSQRWLRQEDIFLLVAPRPMQGFRGSKDSRVDQHFNEVLKQTWNVTGSEHTPRIDLIEGGAHEFFLDETRIFLSTTLELE